MVVPPRFQGDRRFVFGERRAFTLVELLVLGVIIALSVGLVAPSLDVARQQSMHALCLNRLGAIGDATTIYTTDDPEEFALPLHPLWTAQDPQDPSYIGAYEWGGQSGVGGPYVVPGPGGEYEFLNSKYGTRAGFGPATRPLNTILYPHGFVDNLHTDVGYDRHGAAKDTQLRLDAYKCPADDGPPGGGHCPPWIEHADRSAYDHFGTSYSANKFMTSFSGPTASIPGPRRRSADGMGRTGCSVGYSVMPTRNTRRCSLRVPRIRMAIPSTIAPSWYTPTI